MKYEVIRSALYKFCVMVAIVWALALAPSPSGAISFQLKNGLLGIACVLYVGKLLYDSLFYDRYPR